MDIDSRNADIESRYRNGETLQDVGAVYGLTRERIRQILVKRGVSSSNGGISVKVRRKEAVKLAEKQKTIGKHFCRKCGTWDSVDNFYRVKNGQYTTLLHKPCRDKYMRQWYLKRRDKK